MSNNYLLTYLFIMRPSSLGADRILRRTLSVCLSVRVILYDDLEIRDRGQSMSLKRVPFDRSPMICYYCSVLTLSLKRTVFEIFASKNAVTLKLGFGVTQGHRKWYQSIERMRLPIYVL